jgi:mannosyltransferase OCH1-like enzyme
MSAIPKRIIQTARRRALSPKHRAVAANLRFMNGDFEYAFFDDEEVERFVDREFPQYRRVFDGFRFPIQRYDFFRYLAVYSLGGFYFDLDVLLAKSVQDLLESSCVFPCEGLTFSRYLRDFCGMDWQIGNYAFGATPGHPFLEAAIENCVRAQRDPSWIAAMMRGVPPLSRAEHFVLNTTGPGMLSRTLAENHRLGQTVTVLFPDDVCDPQTWNLFGDHGVHLMEGSWRLPSGLVRRRLAQRWEERTLEQLTEQSRRLGRTRQIPGKASPEA